MRPVFAKIVFVGKSSIRPFANFLPAALAGTLALCLFAYPAPSQAKASSAAYTPANVHAGEQVFLQRCFACHSINQGETRIGPSLFHVMKGPKAVSAAAIHIQLRDGKGKMPPFKDILTPDDVDHVIAYLHSL
jgi:mono/diheme cytochrome c family protein